MQNARLLVGLLLLATALVDLAVLAAVGNMRESLSGLTDSRVLIIGALVFSQTSLLAILAALGRLSSPWPWAGLFCGVLIEALYFSFLLHKNKPAAILGTMVLLLFQAGLVFVILLLGRWRARRRSAALSGERPAPPLQYSLGQLFAWITGVALCLGFAQWVLTRTLDGSKIFAWLEDGLLYGLSNTLLAVAAAWLLLGSRRAWLRLGALGVALLMAPWIMAEQGVAQPFLANLFLGLAEALLLLVSLAVVRLAGYRLGPGAPLASTVASDVD